MAVTATHANLQIIKWRKTDLPRVPSGQLVLPLHGREPDLHHPGPQGAARRRRPAHRADRRRPDRPWGQHRAPDRQRGEARPVRHAAVGRLVPQRGAADAGADAQERDRAARTGPPPPDGMGPGQPARRDHPGVHGPALESPPANLGNEATAGQRVNGILWDDSDDRAAQRVARRQHRPHPLWATAATPASTTLAETSIGGIAVGEMPRRRSLLLAKRLARRAEPGITPYRDNEDQGREWFVAFVGSNDFRDLAGDTAIMNANLYARPREGNGVDRNPLFQDGDLIYRGMIIREIPEIDTSSPGDRLGLVRRGHPGRADLPVRPERRRVRVGADAPAHGEKRGRLWVSHRARRGNGLRHREGLQVPYLCGGCLGHRPRPVGRVHVVRVVRELTLKEPRQSRR